MNVEVQIVNPIDYAGWDDMLLAARGHSIFHTAEWARVLNETYGYTPIYMTAVDNGRLLALIPVMEVNSFITGKRGVSLPFSDYCEPLIDDTIAISDLMIYIKDYGRKARWRYFELRGGDYKGSVPSSYYYRQELDLTSNPEQIFARCSRDTRGNVNRALRDGVNVNLDNTPESMRIFYRLNCITRKRHGLPSQPFKFFEKIHEHLISKGYGIVAIASFNDINVASALYLNFGERAVYKYSASDMNFKHLRANNLVMWKAIKWYHDKGYKTMCFGRTEPDNKGLRRFKARWGTSETIMNYYKYDLQKHEFVKDSSLPIYGIHNKIFSHAPIPVLKLVSSLVYKHMG